MNGSSSKHVHIVKMNASLTCMVGKRESMSPSATSGAFELAKDDEQEDAQVKVQAQNGNSEQISAADYDPSLDRREDEQRRVLKDEPVDVETIEEEEEEDVDDMFAVISSDKKKVKKVKKVVSIQCYLLIAPINLFDFRNLLLLH